jgi:hypothetical protein
MVLRALGAQAAAPASAASVPAASRPAAAASAASRELVKSAPPSDPSRDLGVVRTPPRGSFVNLKV